MSSAPPPENSSFALEDKPQFPGSRSSFIDKLEFLEPDAYEGIPVYRVMDRKGQIINPTQEPEVTFYIV